MIVTVTLNPAVDKKLTVGAFNAGETNKCFLERADVSGKGINVSKTAAALGADTTACGFLGPAAEKEFKDYLDSHKISHDFTRIKGDVRTNIKLVETETGRETEINENGPVIAQKEAADFLCGIKKYFNAKDILCVSGSLPGGLAPSFYSGIILEAKDAGMRVIFDSSEAAFAAGVNAAPYAIKPNLYELESFFREKFVTPVNPEQTDGFVRIKEKAKGFLNMGIETVIVSMGRLGALFVSKTGALHAYAASDIPVRGTIGAGDALTAAFAVALERNLDFEHTARLCVASASASVAEEGTVPGRTENIEYIMGCTEVKEI